MQQLNYIHFVGKRPIISFLSTHPLLSSSDYLDGISLTYDGVRDLSISIDAVGAVINWPIKGLRGDFRKVLAASLFPKEETE